MPATPNELELILTLRPLAEVTTAELEAELDRRRPTVAGVDALADQLRRRAAMRAQATAGPAKAAGTVNMAAAEPAEPRAELGLEAELAALRRLLAGTEGALEHTRSRLERAVRQRDELVPALNIARADVDRLEEELAASHLSGAAAAREALEAAGERDRARSLAARLEEELERTHRSALEARHVPAVLEHYRELVDELGELLVEKRRMTAGELESARYPSELERADAIVGAARRLTAEHTLELELAARSYEVLLTATTEARTRADELLAELTLEREEHAARIADLERARDYAQRLAEVLGAAGIIDRAEAAVPEEHAARLALHLERAQAAGLALSGLAQYVAERYNLTPAGAGDDALVALVCGLLEGRRPEGS